MNRADIDLELEKVFDPSFVKLWWGLELPGLGKRKPNDVYEESPQEVYDYVTKYTEEDTE